MNRQGWNQHEWGIIAQEKEPYREYHYCDLCKRFKDFETGQLYTKSKFKIHIGQLRVNGRVLYEPDSAIPFVM